jgi:hypothetical protein
MAAWVTQSDFMKLWTQSGQVAERKLQKFLLAGLDEISKAKSDVASKIKKAESISTPVVRWMEEYDYPTQLTALWNGSTTLTISGNLFNAAVTLDTIQKIVRVGTILERRSDGVQLKVSSVAGIADDTPFEAVVALYGNTTGAADSPAAVTWEIISEVWSDYKEVDSTRSLDRSFREVGTQIWAETFDIPWTRKNTSYELVKNEEDHQIKKLLEKLRRHVSMALLRGRPYYSSSYKYGNQTEESTMLGLITWPEITQAECANTNVYVPAAGAEISKSAINDLVRNLWLDENADYGQGDWYIVCHPLVAKYIMEFDSNYRRMTQDATTVGYAVNVFDSDVGKSFPIVADQYWRPDVLQLVDFSKCSYGYYNNDEMTRKKIETAGRFDRWLLTFQTYGLVVREPRRSIGMIYGLATS